MEAEWMRCEYFAWWDVPCTWILPWQGRMLLLDSPFEKERDDYSPNYSVWELSVAVETEIAPCWKDVQEGKTRRRPDVPITAFQFDAVREKMDSYSYVRVRIVQPHLIP